MRAWLKPLLHAQKEALQTFEKRRDKERGDRLMRWDLGQGGQELSISGLSLAHSYTEEPQVWKVGMSMEGGEAKGEE